MNRSPAWAPRGHGFRRAEPEAMGSESETYDLALRWVEPIASGLRLPRDIAEVPR
jgi:hypothetical protein